jgi:hypothetical protein
MTSRDNGFLLVARRVVELTRAFKALAKEKGPQGDKGDKGDKGDRGDTGPAPAHRWTGTKLQFQKPDGEWGKKVDLKGEKGDKGSGAGTIVIGSSGGGFDLNTIEVVMSIVPGDQMLMMRGGALVRIAIQPSDLPDGAITVNGEPVLVNGEYVVGGT